MHWKRALLIALGLAAASALSVAPVQAQSPVRIVENRHDARFAELLSFSLVAESDDPVQNVTLYYRRQSERVTSRVTPDFIPGRQVHVAYEKELERGEIPPGTEIEYYWRLDLASGAQFHTDPLSFVYEDNRFSWQSLKAGDITIYYYNGGQAADLAKDLAARGEATLTRLQTQAGVTLEAPIRVYVYRDASDMAAALAPRSEGFDDRVLTLGVAVGDDALLLLGSHSGIQQTLAHELSHVVVGLATKNPYAPLPRWLDEGLAMYAQGDLPPENAAALQHATSRDDLISVRSLSGYTGDPGQVDLYYGEVYSLVEFLLRTQGREKMGQLLQVFRQGSYQDDALQQVYGLTIDDLDARWRESLGLQPRPVAGPGSTPAPVRARERPLPCPTSNLVVALALAMAFGLRRASPA